MDLASLIPLLLKISIALSVMAIGFKATLSQSVYLFRRPMELARALLSMHVLMPFFALLVGLVFDLSVAVEITLVALSISPIPPILPNKALKAGGREDYTIGLLVATAVLSILTIPVGMALLHGIIGFSVTTSAMSVAIVVAKVVLSSVLIPLIIGIGIRALAPELAVRLARPVGIVGMILLILSSLPILFTSVRAILTIVGDGTLIALTSFAIVGLIVGHLLGGPQPENQPVLALATATRHPAVAFAIAHAYFPQQKLAGAMVLVYLVISVLAAAPYLTWIRRAHLTQATTEKHVVA